MREKPKSKPLVLIVNVFYPPQFIGGATRVVESCVRHALQYSDEFDVEVVCARDSGGEEGQLERYVWDGVTVTSFSPFLDADEIERSAKTDAMFERLFDRLKPDLAHFHCIQRITASALDVARRRGVPYLVTAHDGWWISDKQFLIDEKGRPVYESNQWGAPRRLTRLQTALRHGLATVAVSESLGRLYRARGIGNVIVCPNGSDTLPKVAAPPASGPVYIGLLGGLGLAKGADLLKMALLARRYDNLRFIIVDHSQPEGSTYMRSWGENIVECVGKTKFDAVGKIYSRLHAILAISVCVESFGLVAREAARLQRWVIASDRGGIGEDVRDNIDGFVIDVSSPGPLIEILDKINADPDRFRKPAPQPPQLRDSQDHARDMVGLYRQALAQKTEVAGRALELGPGQ